jgi:phosphoserine phosphatase RsbU/P
LQSGERLHTISDCRSTDFVIAAGTNALNQNGMESSSVNSADTDDKNTAWRLKKLIEANQSLAEIESLDTLVPTLLDLARDVTSAEASSFLTYEPEREVLRFSAIRDEHLDSASVKALLESVEVPLGIGIAGCIAQKREPKIVEDAQAHNCFYDKVDKCSGVVTRSVLGVPVLYGHELLGVIEVLNPIEKACFERHDQDILESFANLAAVAIIRARFLEERLKQETLKIQMETAAKIQSVFRPLPPPLKYGSHIWAYSKPARFVGGDLYDMIPMKDDSWLVYVADVSDKGLPAALIMAALWYRIRSEAYLHADVARLLGVLNESLYRLLSAEGYFVTIAIGQYWPRTGQLALANGGHPSVLKIGAGNRIWTSDNRGLSLGLAESHRYDMENITLLPGEAVLFSTDGVTESADPSGTFFGNRGMRNAIGHATGPPWGKTVLGAVNDWQAGSDPSDDLTLLEIWREP